MTKKIQDLKNLDCLLVTLGMMFVDDMHLFEIDVFRLRHINIIMQEFDS